MSALADPFTSAYAPRSVFANTGEGGLFARPKSKPASRRGASGGGTAAMRIPRFTGTCLIGGLFLAVASFGVWRGGELDAFLARNGAVKEVLARSFGLGITTVEVSGAARLSAAEVVAAAGIDGRGSLLFADVEGLRERLKANPMIAEASVRKLYPHALVISVTERQPFALWQKDGEVSLVAIDGTPIDALRDQRYVDLPLVVGEGANERVKDFAALLDTQPSLKPLVRAGNWVGQRHWELQLKSGLMVKLPEAEPAAAWARFAGLMRDYKLSEKALILVDLRLPDRVIFRLTEEAAAERNEEMKKRLPPFKGEPG
ncbi:MAG: FtsQ-type POTRA domain-containing protein [Hyphomicrobiales bacterium]|nr:FtsQ-type POTRA domain-containing protein [Hyphomicrobiales bacterium]